jgi:hypothetical protein
LAFGDFVVRDPDTVIGEAVAQAAAVYDRHDHIGIVVEPNTSALLEKLCDADDVTRVALTQHISNHGITAFRRWPIGFKGQPSLSLWTIPWTGIFAEYARDEYQKGEAEYTPRAAFIDCVWGGGVPLEAQDKCYKLLSYFDDYNDFINKLREVIGDTRPHDHSERK